MISRKLWELSSRILCNPYAYVHQRPYWFGRLHETHIERYMKSNLSKGDTFIDVGCNCGHHSILGACLVGAEGKVISFEPNKKLVTLLEAHLTIEKLQQITLYPIALGTKKSTISLYLEDDNCFGSSHISLPERPVLETKNPNLIMECEIDIGDEFIHFNQLKGKVFLKVDVEGAEIEALSGLKQTLSNYVSHAVVEVTPEWLGGTEGVNQLFNLMSDAGLTAYELLPDGKVGSIAKPAEIKKQVDVLFLRSIPAQF